MELAVIFSCSPVASSEVLTVGADASINENGHGGDDAVH
jgi:hypothetical protein